MSKIAVFLAKGFEEIEALTVVDICRRAEIEVRMVSIGDSLTVEGSHGIRVMADETFVGTDFDSLDMLVLPGGMPGTVNLEAHEGLMERLDAFYRDGKFVAAICAAPSIPGHRGLLKGRSACCYPGYEDQLEGASISMEPAVRSEHVITGRGMGCAIPFALKITEALCGEEKAAQIAEAIVYQNR